LRKYFLIFSFFLLFLLSQASAMEISTNAKFVDGSYYVVKGESIEIALSGEPKEETSIRLTYIFTLTSSNGEYSFIQNSFPVPISGDFKIRAYPVENLTLKASFFIFSKTLSANASNGVAEISTNVPISGSFNVEMNGRALGDEVTVESIMSSTIELDERGEYHLSYDTSVLPCGEMTAIVNGETLRVLVVESSSEIPAEETPVPEESSEPTPEETRAGAPSPGGASGGTSTPISESPEPAEEEKTPGPTPIESPQINLTETPELNATVNVTWTVTVNVTQEEVNLSSSPELNFTEKPSEEVEETPTEIQNYQPNESPGFELSALIISFLIIAYFMRKR